MAIIKMPISRFMTELRAARDRKDGYIMCATGQNPKKWKPDSWWFTQYSGDQKKKALDWRENAERVWDCNGLSEGIYKDYTGVDINTKARYNYSQWCAEIHGKGTIPVERRVEGAAVFTYSSKSGYITHVGYLDKPVKEGHPEGDWYVIEARGVMHGVVTTKLYDKDRTWNRWGWMTKYFDYNGTSTEEQLLRNGCEGDDVQAVQTDLIKLGYDLGEWGADGDFGDATEMAVEKFQSEHGCEVDGIVGPETREAIEKALAEINSAPAEVCPKTVEIVDGNCYIRSAPNTSGKKLGVAYRGDKLEYGGQTADNGWNLVVYKNANAWVSGKYSKLVV